MLANSFLMDKFQVDSDSIAYYSTAKVHKIVRAADSEIIAKLNAGNPATTLGLAVHVAEGCWMAYDANDYDTTLNPVRSNQVTNNPEALTNLFISVGGVRLDTIVQGSILNGLVTVPLKIPGFMPLPESKLQSTLKAYYLTRT